MKLRVFLVTAVFLSANLAPAQAAPAALLPAPPAVDAGQIGVVAAVKGSVTIQKPGKVGEIVRSGEAVYLGDMVSTDEQGALQILLLDETIFTIGPNSAIVIDKFVYDPATDNGKVEAKVVKGVFRFVTGKIARKKPDDMKVELPSGSIGIRGTIVLGESVGSKSTVVLMGPGARTNTTHRVGQITLNNEVGGKTEKVTVTRAGFGSTIDGPGSAPTAPFEVPASELARMSGGLQPAAEDSSAGGEDSGAGAGGQSASEEAGQDTAAGGESAELSGDVDAFIGELNGETERAAQEALEEAEDIEDGVTFFDELERVQSGKFQYTESGVDLFDVNNNPTNSYDFTFEIDFGARTVGGGNSKVIADVGGSTQYALDAQPFGSGDGPAVFFYDNVMGSGACSVCTADVTVALVNEGGVIASSAAHEVSVTNASNTFTGDSITDGRDPI